MARRATVGLDIGTSGVRAAEISVGKAGTATLRRFGQVAQPPGAVHDGEVVDPVAVGTAVKQLWSQAGFSTRKVVVGVANQRVVVRRVDLPWMPAAEPRAALAFQVQDFIPMPVEQAILDFHPTGEYVNESGGRMLRVLLVAAAREMVDATIAAVEQGGLSPVVVDLTPFAVLRSLAPLDELGLRGGDAEALVDVGADVTNIVVHQGGVPRFVRILLLGGNDITEAVADRMGVPAEEAEAIKQSIGLPVDPTLPDAHPASGVIATAGAALVEEVRGSLDYYLTQPEATRLDRVVLSGGGGLLLGLAERLSAAARLPVTHRTAFPRLTIGKTGLSADQLAYVEPLASVPVGLALGGLG